MNWVSLFRLPKHSEAFDPYEDTVIDGVAYRSEAVPLRTRSPVSGGKGPDTRLAEELRRRGVAMVRAR
jgi:hypothetical protein